jgi:hypothetical protein
MLKDPLQRCRVHVPVNANATVAKLDLDNFRPSQAAQRVKTPAAAR